MDGKSMRLRQTGKEIQEILDNASNLISITYAELVTLRDNGELVAGRQYRITDFVTTTTQANTRSAGHQFDVIVTADNKNTLNEAARACLHDGDTYFSEAGARLEAWQIWYCLDNDAKRFAWAAPADGKYEKVALVKYGYSDYTAYHDASKDTEVNGKKLYAWNQGGGPGHTGYSDTLDITSSSKVYTQSGNEDTSASFLVDIKNTEKGKGVIYRMIDEFNNDLPYDFKNIQYSIDSQLVYTFAEAADLSGGCRYNEIKTYRKSGKQVLNNIRFGNSCYSNTFGKDCHNNSFVNNCYSNTFGEKCSNNSFGYNCYSYSFSNDCSNISFGESCYFNSFGNNCSNVELSRNTYYKTASINSNDEVKVFNLADLADLLNS